MAIGISRETMLLVVLLLREMRLWGLHLGDHPIAVGSSGGGGGDTGGADSAGSSGHHAGRAGRAPDTEVGLRGSIRSILLASLVVVVPVWNWSGRLHHLLNVPGTGCGLQQSVLLCRGDEVPDWDRSGRLHHLLSVPSIGCGLPKSILLSLVVGGPSLGLERTVVPSAASPEWTGVRSSGARAAPRTSIARLERLPAGTACVGGA